MSDQPLRATGSGEPPLGTGGGSPKFVDEREPAHRILEALSKIGTALRANAWENAAQRRLNPTQLKILALLERRDRSESSVTFLADQLGVTPATVSDSVSALVKKGLVQKRPRIGDARALTLLLTESGRAAALEALSWPEQLLRAVDFLPGEEQAALLRSCSRIIRALQQSGRIATARMCVTCRFFRAHRNPDASAPHHCLFAEADFGALSLRLDCRDHEVAGSDVAASNWAALDESAI